MSEAKTVVQIRPVSSGRLPAGTRLNDIYEIEEQIAAGGMGEIYRGRLIETGDAVAIKMIRPELAENEAVIALFRKEASSLHHLHHDAIVRYYVFTVDRRINRPYLAMEFVEGRSLGDLIRNRPMTFEEVDQLRKRLALGLQVAHDKGIIHRDIAPDNIILPKEDVRQAKIIDFGIARQTKLGEATIIGDGFAGKYNYVSPEQLGLFGGVVTNRSDIYSLGLVLAECLLGKAIDMSGSQADVIDKRRVVPDLSKLDKRMRPLIARMLAPKPDDRPVSMSEVAEWSYAAVEASERAARQGKLGTIAAGIAGLALAGGGGWWYLGRSVEPPRPAVAISQPPGPPPNPGPDAPTTRTLVPGPPPRRPPVLSAGEQITRIADYVRYYEGDGCLLLQPAGMTARSASIQAMASDASAIARFEAEFREVNGFSPEVAAAPITQAQCALVGFVQRVDAAPDPDLQAVLLRARVPTGAGVEFDIRGLGERSVELLSIAEDGTVRRLTGQLARRGSAAVLRTRLPEQINLGNRQTVLLSIVSTGKLTSTDRIGDGAPSDKVLPEIAAEIEKTGIKVAIVPTQVAFE
jgi:serine/threonine-protein kinase